MTKVSISARDVKQLRDKTGAGMMDCKRALSDANGDLEAAIDLLRKKGQRVAAKRADREALQGLVVTRIDDTRRTGIIVEVNCETDFVARNEEFVSFAHSVADLILSARPSDLDALFSLSLNNGRTVGEIQTDLTGKIGEKLGVRRFSVLSSEDGQVIDYIHPGSRLGVLVSLNGNGDLTETGKDVAMQVAALNPLAAHREDVPQETQDKEFEIGREAARLEGKPEQILDRIAKGKLERFFKDNVLVEQPFVKDASLRVRDVLGKAGADVNEFVRCALGE
ncbi:MAG: elongation factor Ts [Rhodothermaceae bacterium]|nr:translation elongation factor Ts [Bacteroidota bacterium]MXW15161.1 elongation factor Ts [Rhodothermaceae bacterium]MYC03086.1 elongation factor Ts [Rhodothermaceae bacterium]MYI16539.1 elongation factor Ts [Rhodothermaceae bacterium]